MASILWAIGAATVLILIITLLPLGFTFKGKLMISFLSFVLSLGGLAAISIIPLWETALMLLALSFFAAYFMNNRLGTMIVQENPVFVEHLDKEFDTPETSYEIESLNNGNLAEIDDELHLPDSSNLKLEKDTVTDVTSSHVLSEIKDEPDHEQESNDMDISFLLERDNEVVEVKTQIDEQNMENDYLSDIESLLELESMTEQVETHEDTLDLSPIQVETNLAVEREDEEQELSDDSLFDFLLAKKEVAADREDVLNVIEPKDKIVLQK
ncbi:hypothetical protein [Neobacillus sp. OS1-33]|uniref:hypothetical protein n=1 Tax=Neobacillus sp. OS1-33 TaxID=3070683 RepID=UPI0027E130AD|nr:hypothetical protein [Neobacillus sp. OS1-33]WML25424.1 hypothetical protein RCG22_21755 [Neobacillus sp. OS1-33]